jgi:hypothetical protein
MLRARKECTVSVFAAVALALCVAGADDAQAAATVTVTFITGKADVTSKGGTTALKVGSVVAEGDTVETREDSKLELSMPDGSKLRLAPKTKVVLSEGTFNEGKGRNVKASVWVGRLWAKVAKSIGGGDSFEVETRNAVAGVRGTSFAVQASADLSAVVRVYAGTVGVRKADADGAQFGSKPPRERKKITGPERIDKKQWEEIIATAMKQVKVTSVGDIAPAEDFEDQGEDLQWAMWNKERDKSH